MQKRIVILNLRKESYFSQIKRASENILIQEKQMNVTYPESLHVQQGNRLLYKQIAKFDEVDRKIDMYIERKK